MEIATTTTTWAGGSILKFLGLSLLAYGTLPFRPLRPQLLRMPVHPVVHIEYPAWVDTLVDWERTYANDDDKMRLAIDISRENVERGTGGPFGAAIFEIGSGRLVSVGMNSVVRLNNCTLHGEMVAFMMAQQQVQSFTLNAPNLAAHELITSCEPCAMCLGATLWSGVRRVAYGAAREDASKLRFEEGPVFPESYRYVEDRGLEITRNVLRPEARAVLELYRAKSGKIYNG
jgi:tRNA(Arg) A34 adenosine deaminase TadA